MSSALDAFRAQQEAADAVYGRLHEISALLQQVRIQVDAIARNDELKAVLHLEQSWLAQAQRTVADVRAWREREARWFWPGVVRRWTIALVFALASAAAAGAGYAWAIRPEAGELATLRARAEFADLVERRVLTMTPAERRQFDNLMKRIPKP